MITVFWHRKPIGIRIDDIVYLQAENKVCHIVTKLGNYTVCRSLKSLIDELPKDDFFRTHRTVAVNMKYISSFTSSCVKMDTGLSIPMSRGRYNEFSIAFANFLSYRT